MHEIYPETGFQYHIVCPDCGNELMKEHPDFKIYAAIFGDQGRGDEDAVLVCSKWDDQNPLAAFADPTTPYFCDGCGEMVAVSKSSKWFAEKHRKERG